MATITKADIKQWLEERRGKYISSDQLYSEDSTEPRIDTSRSIRLHIDPEETIRAGGEAVVAKAKVFGPPPMNGRTVALRIVVDTLASDDKAQQKSLLQVSRISRQERDTYPALLEVYADFEIHIPYEELDVVANAGRTTHNVWCQISPWGVPLDQYLHNRTLGEEAACRLILPLLKTIDALHTNERIIHRDIHQNNVIIIDKMPYVTDFGIAKRLREGLSHTSTAFAGKYGAIPPELWQEKGHVTDAADSWQLGRLLFWMISKETSPVDYFNAKPWNAKLEKVSPQVRKIIESLCRKSPSERMKLSEAAKEIDSWITRKRRDALRKMNEEARQKQVEKRLAEHQKRREEWKKLDTEFNDGWRRFGRRLVTSVATLLTLSLLFVGRLAYLEFLDARQNNEPIGTTLQSLPGQTYASAWESIDPLIRRLRLDGNSAPSSETTPTECPESTSAQSGGKPRSPACAWDGKVEAKTFEHFSYRNGRPILRVVFESLTNSHAHDIEFSFSCSEPIAEYTSYIDQLLTPFLYMPYRVAADYDAGFIAPGNGISFLVNATTVPDFTAVMPTCGIAGVDGDVNATDYSVWHSVTIPAKSRLEVDPRTHVIEFMLPPQSYEEYLATQQSATPQDGAVFLFPSVDGKHVIETHPLNGRTEQTTPLAESSAS